MSNSEIFDRSILVVAHLDDEALWFSSILDHVDSIYVVYLNYAENPSLTQGRKNSLANHPLPDLKCLGIEEPRSFNMAKWDNPVETKFGLKLANSKKAEIRYQKSYSELIEKLEDVLKNYKNVFTHNPWGEYGHEDHVQTFRAVQSLSSKLELNIWYSNYCGNRSIPLMLKSISGFSSNYFTLKTNTELANKLCELYKSNSCWTWYNDYCWFQEESFMHSSSDSALDKSYGHIFPLNMIKTDFDKKDTIMPRVRKKISNLKNLGRQ